MTEYDYQLLDDDVCGGGARDCMACDAYLQGRGDEYVNQATTMTAQGDPVMDLCNPEQRIRRTSNGYVVTLVYFGEHGWACGDAVFERPEFGDDDAIERALMSIVETIGDCDEQERVARKFWPREDYDE